MNKYGRLAMSHWQRTDPQRYHALTSKEAFFTELGEQAAQEIYQLADALAGADPPGEGYLEKVGRLNMAQLAAEEQVLRELILIPLPKEAEEEGSELDWTMEMQAAFDRVRREDSEQEG